MKLHFPGQKENEDILFVVRKHWILYVNLVFFLGLMVGLPLIVLLGIEWQMELSLKAQETMLLFFLLYLNFILLVTFIRWLEEEADLLIVTNERILSVDQVSFLHRTISESELTQIQDVKYVSRGVLGSLLGFGSLEVQTAGERILFEIRNVIQPHETSRRIMDLCRECKQKFAAPSAWTEPQHSTPLPPAL